jgi:signal transduction histidine kinase
MDFMKRLLALRFRISTQLFAAFGVAVALTVAASLIGWFSFARVGEAQAEVNEGSIPEMEAAFGVAEYSNALGASAPRLATASTKDELDRVYEKITTAKELFQEHLHNLEDVDRERSRRIRIYSEALETYIETIRETRQVSFGINEKSDALLGEMEKLRDDLETALIPAVDEKFFYIVTGRLDLNEGEAAVYSDHFSEEEFETYRHLSALQADTSIALQQLSSVFSIFDPTLVEAQKERFESSIASIERNMASLGDDELEAQLAPLYDKLRELGLAREGIFLVLRSRLLLENEQDVLLDLSRQQTASLASVVDELVGSAAASADEATHSTSQAIATGGTLLLVISVISVITALLVSWLFVGRVLVHRINTLSARMRRMAAGELEEEVEVVGHDELAEMAGALEVFRHNSQEALRLNLVEELNQELEGKNTELETVLEDLQTAQDQIVMREKLAALGEVTAGVAHEIRNPLNFVKNFSELSEELLAEMREAIEDGGDNPDLSLITDISKDLIENLERIRHHGDRANRIVNDMLLMGRGSNNWQPIDLNTLLVEHAMLAYHSARATDTQFQLTVQQELDEQVGGIEAIPQDLGRTFLNIVGNACQATDEKRRKLTAEGVSFDGYAPTVWLFTRGMEDEVEIRIRDNGPGIPQDNIEKVFNPFFTTKPTNQGTGLGLAITSDIIRKHGGTIRVESEPDQYTEMIITIPRTPPAEVVQDSTDAAAAASS